MNDLNASLLGASSLTFIDLFAGAGGLTEGFKQAGFNCLLGTDIDGDCAATHKRNHPEVPFYSNPIETLSSVKIRKLIGTNRVDVVIGGPPCQGFSVNAPIRRWDDPRNSLFTHFVRIVKAVQPSYVVFENVPGLISMENGKIVDAIYAITCPTFCTKTNERVYITARACELGFGGTKGLQAAGAGGL